MALDVISTFNARQHMLNHAFEIYHYCDNQPHHVEMHSHDFFEMYFVLEGEMDYTVDGTRYALSPGKILLISPHTLHYPICQSDAVIDRIVLWVSMPLLATLAERGNLPIPHQTKKRGMQLISPPASEHALLDPLLRLLLAEFSSNRIAHMQICEALLTALYILLYRNILSEHPDATHAPLREAAVPVRDIIHYINTHLDEPLLLVDLAELFFVDVNTLTRQFKEKTGYSPGKYILKQRLALARIRIQEGMSIAEASAQCGFAYYSTFFRAFKNEYGISPSVFAQSCQHTQLAETDVHPKPNDRIKINS